MEDQVLDDSPSSEAQSSVTWRNFLIKGHKILKAEKNLDAVEAWLKELQQLRQDAIFGSKRPEIRGLESLAQWRLTGALSTNYRNLNEARIQMWEYEKYCPVFEFQKIFTKKVAEEYPSAPGPKGFSKIFESIQWPIDDLHDNPEEDIVILRRPNAKITILGFSGNSNLLSGTGWTLFDRAVAQRLGANLIILRDKSRLFYLTGLKSFGTLEQSISGMKNLLAEFKDTKIITTGGSAGVFGALYYSAALGIEKLVVSSGPTSLDIGVDEGDRQRYLILKDMAERGEVIYPNLRDLVVASSIKKIDFFVAGQHKYDMAQMRHLEANFPNLTPHIYYDESSHSVLSKAIPDGSFYNAFAQHQ